MEILFLIVVGTFVIGWIYYKIGAWLEPISGVDRWSTFMFLFFGLGLLARIISLIFEFFDVEEPQAILLGFVISIGLFILFHYIAYTEKHAAELWEKSRNLKKSNKKDYSKFTEDTTLKRSKVRDKYRGSDTSSYKEKESVFKTSSVTDEDGSTKVNQKITKPSKDLTSVGFKVVKKSKE